MRDFIDANSGLAAEEISRPDVLIVGMKGGGLHNPEKGVLQENDGDLRYPSDGETQLAVSPISRSRPFITEDSMEYEFIFEPEANRVLIRACGIATIEGWEALDVELENHPQMRLDLDVLHDYRELDLRQLSTEDIVVSSNFTKEFWAAKDRGRWAFVSRSKADFGMLRMWELRTKYGVNAKIQVFKTIEDANEWLER